jgi:dienelactone hydrolase
MLILALPLIGQDATRERQKRALEDLTNILPPTRILVRGNHERVNAFDASFEEWQRRTGELPPDFDSMPSIPGLPDPLILMESGRAVPVSTTALWEQQKRWIRSQFEHWVIGRMPPPPDNLRAVITATRQEGEVSVREVRLEFGPDHRATLRLELLIPPGKGPFPVFMTDMLRSDPWATPWVNQAVRRGYIGLTYFAMSPPLGWDDDSDAFAEVYPDYDFSCLARWAWSAMRAVDYLYTLPEVDKRMIGITGHSRMGKQALIAAAFDERITAAVPASGNTGEDDPWRYTTDMFNVEPLQQITGENPHWFHPRLRFFAGRENKLPVDQNMLAALVAPRGLLMTASYSEGDGNPLGFEQQYRSVRKVYQFLGKEQNLGLALRGGFHDTAPEDVELYLDFFDTVFGRKAFPKPETWILGYTFDQWLRLSGEKVDPLSYPRREVGDFLRRADGKPVDTVAAWNGKKTSIKEGILWALGEEPAGVRRLDRDRTRLEEIVDTSYGPEGAVLGRPLKIPGVGVVPLGFGDYLRADLYYPAYEDQPNCGNAFFSKRTNKCPVVIWLHPYSYNEGYSAYWYAKPIISSLVEMGFAVLAFDQIGFGTRIHEIHNFYERYPRWSLMGKMVSDTRAAVDALSALDDIDSSRIYLMGYALGAKVALFTAALDDRVAGVAAVAGMAPLRLDTPEKGTEGIEHYSHLHGLLPRFGFFIGNNERLPVDYDEILGVIAPRPVLIIAPTLDRYNPVDDVRRAVEQSRKVYSLLGHQDALELETPRDFNRFPPQTQEEVFGWLVQVAGGPRYHAPSQSASWLP